MPETKYAKAGDVHIAYQVVGEGPMDLVLVWGTMSHVELMWEDPSSAYFLNRLASFSRLIIFDKRGCGLSDRPGGQPSLEERMDDVRAVMDAAGSERAAIFGESEGGPMSLLFAATYPERTSALVLYGSIVRLVDDDFPGSLSRADFEASMDLFVAAWGTGEVIGWFAPSFKAQAPEVLRDFGGRFERAALSPGGFRQVMQQNSEIDARPVAQQVNVPTLVLQRRDDQVVSVEQGRWLATNIAGATYVELEGNDHLPQSGDPEPVLSETEQFLTGVRPGVQSDRVLATVLFTDIVGSTSRAVELGDARWRELLDRHDQIVRRQLGVHRGREVKTTGDGFVATFDGPARAVRCAHAISRAMSASGLTIRAGVHTGEVEVRGDDIGGISVHVAARICAKADARQVLVSRTVKDLVAGSGLVFESLGTFDLKGVPDEWTLYEAADS